MPRSQLPVVSTILPKACSMVLAATGLALSPMALSTDPLATAGPFIAFAKRRGTRRSAGAENGQ